MLLLIVDIHTAIRDYTKSCLSVNYVIHVELIEKYRVKFKDALDIFN